MNLFQISSGSSWFVVLGIAVPAKDKALGVVDETEVDAGLIDRVSLIDAKGLLPFEIGFTLDGVSLFGGQGIVEPLGEISTKVFVGKGGGEDRDQESFGVRGLGQPFGAVAG